MSLDSRLIELQADLQQAQSELAEYQAILQDLPGIYEAKFRQRVHAIAQDIRRLLDERKTLQEKLSADLLSSSEVKPIASSGSPSARSFSASKPGALLLAKLSGWRSDARSLIPFSWQAGLGRRANLCFQIVLGACGLVLVFAWLYRTPRLDQRLPISVQKSATQKSSSAHIVLTLSARGGESWVLVRDHAGRTLLDAVLRDGDIKRVNIGRGLKVRSGRADLLYYGIGSQPAKALGGISDIDWTEIKAVP